MLNILKSTLHLFDPTETATELISHNLLGRFFDQKFVNVFNEWSSLIRIDVCKCQKKTKTDGKLSYAIHYTDKKKIIFTILSSLSDR